MTSFRPSRSRSAIATWAICGRSSPFGALPIGPAVSRAVACVDVAAVDDVVPVVGSPPPQAVRLTAVAAIATNNRTRDHGPRTDPGPRTDQERVARPR